MNWKPASDLTGIKPDALYARKFQYRNRATWIASDLKNGIDLVDEIDAQDRDTMPTVIAYAEITKENDVKTNHDIEAFLHAANFKLAEECERLKSQSHIEWKPLADIIEWPVVGENRTIVTTKNGAICGVDDTTLNFIKNTDGYTHLAIVNLPPAPERKLHKCYMPGCGGDMFPVKAEDSAYMECTKCGATGPKKDTKEEAQEAWGWE